MYIGIGVNEIENILIEIIQNNFIFLSHLCYKIKYATVYYLKTGFGHILSVFDI
jgi:hypothetical protein